MIKVPFQTLDQDETEIKQTIKFINEINIEHIL